MGEATCKTCPFWSVEDEKRADLSGRECRRLAPPAFITESDTGGLDSGWPVTLPTDWCGEHPLRQRDRLAAMAMQAIIGDARTNINERDVALCAYLYADAMLAARGEGTPRG